MSLTRVELIVCDVLKRTSLRPISTLSRIQQVGRNGPEFSINRVAPQLQLHEIIFCVQTNRKSQEFVLQKFLTNFYADCVTNSLNCDLFGHG